MTSIIPNKNKKGKTEKNEALADRVLAYDLAGGKRFCRAGDPSGISCRCFETPFYACNRTGLLAVPAVFRSTHRSRIPSWRGGGNCRSCTCRSVSIAEELLTPLVAAVKAVPVASFVILILIWVSSKNLSVVISFLMVFPILYTNTRNGLRELDTALLEMTDVFSGSAAGAAALGDPAAAVPIYPDGMFTFPRPLLEAGTAAEVIGIPNRSIGEHLYQAKIYLDTPGLFAWTAAIVYVSFCLEKAVLKGMDLAEKRMLVMK